MKNPENLVFPLVMISKNGVIEFCLSEKDLTTCTYKSFIQNYYQGLELIDSDGNNFVIQEASLTKPIGLMQKYFGKRIKVNLIINANFNKLTLPEFQIKMLNAFSDQQDFWEAGGNFKWIEKTIKTSSDIRSILSVMADYYFRGITS